MKTTLTVFALVGALLFAHNAQASALTLYVEQPSREIKVGDTVLLNVYVDTGGAEINVIEGSIRVLGNVVIESVNTGGSVFSIWQTQPIIIGKEITFVGGTPVSVTGKNNKVVTIAIKPLSIGDIKLETLSFQGYLADGKGTIIAGEPSEFESITVGKSTGQPIDESALQDQDTVPPNPFTIEIGREGGFTDGKLFLSFISSDDGSGIKYYEVKEGEKIATVLQGIYVLQNQNYSGKVIVTAFDNAGNVRVQQINIGWSDKLWIIYVLVSVSIVLSVYYLVILYNKKKL